MASTTSRVATTITYLRRSRRPTGTFRTDQTVRGVDRQHLALMRVARHVLDRELVRRIPAADVKPAHLDRHYRSALRLLHHGIVDRIRQRAAEDQWIGAN